MIHCPYGFERMLADICASRGKPGSAAYKSLGMLLLRNVEGSGNKGLHCDPTIRALIVARDFGASIASDCPPIRNERGVRLLVGDCIDCKHASRECPLRVESGRSVPALCLTQPKEVPCRESQVLLRQRQPSFKGWATLYLTGRVNTLLGYILCFHDLDVD